MESTAYRPPRDGIGMLVDAQRRTRSAQRAAGGAAPLRAAGVMVLPNKIASRDFDGVDHDAPGTRGWVLGRDDEDSPSYLILNGVDVHEALQAQIDTLQDIVDTLAAQQVELTAQQAELAAQQVALTAEVARIDALVQGQTVAAVGQASAGYPAITPPTTPTNYANVVIPVPAGYSKASVIAVCNALFAANPTDTIQFRVRINGVDGPVSTIALVAEFDHASAVATRDITGLVAGVDTIGVSARINSGAGIGSAGGINTVVAVTFYR